MRLPSILLFAYFACRVAATASESASISQRRDSIHHPLPTNQLRRAEEKEERSPPRLSPAEQEKLQKLRSLVESAHAPSTSSVDPQIVFSGLSALHQKLMVEFGTKRELDAVLALALKQFVSQEEKPLRDRLMSIQAGREVLGDAELEKTLTNLATDPQILVQKLKSLIENPNLSLMSGPIDDLPEELYEHGPYFEEVLELDQELKKMFPTEKEMAAVENLASKPYWREAEPFLDHVDFLFIKKRELGPQKFESTMKKYANRNS